MKQKQSKQLLEDWKPHKYQKKAVKHLLKQRNSALFLDPGLGKTSITLEALSILKKKGFVKKVLIIAPKRVCYHVWPNEIKKWKGFNHFSYQILHGKDKDLSVKENADIYLVNPEGLKWLFKPDVSRSAKKNRVTCQVDFRKLKELGFDAIVIDEVSKFRNTKSIRYQILRAARDDFPIIWGLTGSPAPNGLLSLFPQVLILDGGKSLGKFITHFIDEYFEKHPKNKFKYVPIRGKIPEIYERISDLALSMTAEDHLTMPALIKNNIRIDLPDDVMEIYKEVEKELISQVLEKKIVAENSIVATGKCRQIANGGCYITEDIVPLLKLPSKKKEWIDIHEEKINAVEDLFDELQGAPLLVAYEFKHDLARLNARFEKIIGEKVPRIGSGVSEKEESRVIEAWNKGDIPLCFIHPESAGHGLNLQGHAQHICYHSLIWNFESYDQLLRRIYRQGNKYDTVFCHNIIARDTIDEVLIRVLSSKNKVQKDLFIALQDLAKKKK